MRGFFHVMFVVFFIHNQAAAETCHAGVLTGDDVCCSLNTSLGSHGSASDALMKNMCLNCLTQERERTDIWLDVWHSLAQIMISLNWQQVVLIRDNDYKAPVPVIHGYVRLVSYSVGKNNTSAQIKNIFRDINQLTPLHVLVLCSESCIVEVLNQANRFDRVAGQQGYFTLRHKWIFVTDLRPNSSISQHIQNISNVVFISVDCNNVSKTQTQILNAVVVDGIEVFTAMWTMDGERELVPVNFLSWKVEPASTSNRVFCYGCDVVDEDVLFPGIKYGFNRQHLLVSTNTWAPFVMKELVEGLPVYNGFCIEVLDALSQSLNFTYSLVEPPDGQWGAIDNGSWTGLIGQLAYQEVDMVVAPVSSDWKREHVADFSETAMYVVNIKGMIKLEDQKDSTLELFAKPFKPLVWMCIAVSVLIGTAAMWLFSRLNPCCVPKSPEETDAKMLARSYHALWFAFGAVFNQGAVHVPRHQSGRVFVSAWWLYCIILGAVYTGNLIAFISVVIEKYPFYTLKQMVEQDDYTFGTLGGTRQEQGLKEAQLGISKTMWDKMQNFLAQGHSHVLSTNNSDHVIAMKTSKYVYFSDVVSHNMEAMNDCSLRVLPESLEDPLRYSVAFQNNSAYRDLIAPTMLDLRDNGLFEQWKEIYIPKDNSRTGCGNSNGLPPPVTLLQISGVFIGLASLILSCFLVLLMEILFHKYVSGCVKQDDFRKKISPWNYFSKQ